MKQMKGKIKSLKLKHVNSNGEIIVAINLYPMNLFVLKNYKNWVQKWILYNIF